ncbi:MAG TPA: hypothetical protein VL401_03080 [Alphaproteobacteria bacterium]|jgi:hypothetical protein|nr:hypothetical protein [Alphaproteobacteria bacterium]
MLHKFEKVLITLIIFLIPTQLAFHFWPNWAFIFGIRIDYLAPTIYLTDILIFVFLVLNLKIILKFKKYIFFLSLFAFVNIYFSISPFASFFKWLHIFEYIFFAICLYHKKINFNILYYSAVFFSLIGIFQFLLGHTLNGIFYFLGERTFDINIPGIALVEIWGRDFLRAYSTFPHPNALAGFLGICLILLFKDFKNKLGFWIIALGFILTFSLSAFLALAIALVFRKHSSKIFWIILVVSLLLPFVASKLLGFNFPENIRERLELVTFLRHSTGLNTFVLYSRFLQPVHNIFLLVFSELGIVGLGLFAFYFHRFFNKFPAIFIFILVTGFTDHYWLTSHQNLLLLSLISATLYQWKKV